MSILNKCFARARYARLTVLPSLASGKLLGLRTVVHTCPYLQSCTWDPVAGEWHAAIGGSFLPIEPESVVPELYLL